MPIAIQYYANRAENNPVWTPKDSRADWLLAKIIFNNANAQCQQIMDHLVDCHYVAGAYALALKRNLFQNHPVYRLLHPHLKTVIGANATIPNRLAPVINYLLSIGMHSFSRFFFIKNKLWLLGNSDSWVKIMQLRLKQWSVQHLNIPKRFEDLGLDDINMV